MEIERFVWSSHALARLEQRRLTRSDVEQAIAYSHGGRQANVGKADWIVGGITSLGVPFEAIYDHPVGDDEAAVLIVSAWRVKQRR